MCESYLTSTFLILIKAYSKIKWWSQLYLTIHNLESGCGSNFLLNVINSKDLRLDIRMQTSSNQCKVYLTRIPDYCCENCNKVHVCTTSSPVSNIVEMLMVQLVIFRYDPINNRSRNLIPNLKIDDTAALIEKSSILGIMLASRTKY